MMEPEVVYAHMVCHDPPRDGDFWEFVTSDGRRNSAVRMDNIWVYNVNEQLPWWRRFWYWLLGLIFGRARIEVEGNIDGVPQA